MSENNVEKSVLKKLNQMIIFSNISKYSSIIAIVLVIISIVFFNKTTDSLSEELFSSFIDKLKHAYGEHEPIVIATITFTIIECIASVVVICFAFYLKTKDKQKFIENRWFRKIIVHSFLSIFIFSFIFSWIVEKYIKKIEHKIKDLKHNN